jgi:iron complex transport system substrate-binding protein
MRLIALLFLLVGWIVPAVADTVRITDAIGRVIDLPKPPERLVVTLHYEEITAIAGAEGWKKVVAMSRAPWESWRPAIYAEYLKAIPVLASTPDTGDIEDQSFSAEKVIAVRPDVLVLSNWGFENAKAQVERIQQAGIPVVVLDYHAQDLAKHLASTRALGRLFGTEARAEELARFYEREYTGLVARTTAARASKPKPKAYVEFGREGAETIGNSYNNAMWGRILTLLGAENLAEGRIPGAWGPLNAETVIAENPDAIFLASSSWMTRPKAVKTGYGVDAALTRATLLPYLARPGWKDQKAVRSGNVNAVEHGLSRTLFDIVATQFIAKRLYPEALADLDPEKTFREIHAKYLPVAYSGTWFLAIGEKK